MSHSIPKSKEKPYRSMKGKVRQSERPYTLQLLDERARKGSIPAGYPDFMERLNVAVPTASLGWCLPNNFEVSIDGLIVRFRVELLKKANIGQWAITSLEITAKRKGAAIEVLELPLQTFLRDAINLSTLRCITYPPGYEGVSVHWPSAWLKSDEGESYVEVQGWADSTPAPLLRDFTKVGSGRKRDSAERLAIVLKAYESAPHGEKRSRVKEALEKSEQVVSDATVKRLIAKVRTETRSKK
jgi:hypothetical protein